MAITDNKVTATPLTVGVGSAPDLIVSTTPAEYAAAKAIYDAYPDAIKQKHDDLIDYINELNFSYSSTAAAATASKGSFTGWIPMGAIIELSMTNGNTAVSPTITIDGAVHAITGMPTTARVQANSTQTYRLVKTGTTALTFTKNPNYICEYGSFTPTITAQAGAITSYTSSGYFIKRVGFMEFLFDIDITNKGTGSTGISISLPITPTLHSSGIASEYNLTGYSGSVLVTAGGASGLILKYDGTTLIATNHKIAGSVIYAVA